MFFFLLISRLFTTFPAEWLGWRVGVGEKNEVNANSAPN